MNTNQEDIQLIQGVLNKDSNSQNKLYDKYTTYVRNFLKKNYTTYYDLDDDVSEILIKIFLGLHSFDANKSSFTSWVCTIAKNHMIDKWRSNDISYVLTNNISGNFITSSVSYYDENLTISNTSSDDSTASIATNTSTFNDSSYATQYSSTSDYELNNTVSYVTSELSNCDCMLLHMKYIYGYDYCEIGNEFNISSTTASNRVNYIKSKLKKHIAEIVD